MWLFILFGSIFTIIALVYWRFGQFITTRDKRMRLFAESYKMFPVYHTMRTLHFKKHLFEGLTEFSNGGSKAQRILEIGIGPGANLEFYPKNTKLIALDNNQYFKAALEDNVKKHPNVTLEKFVVNSAENMTDIPDNSVDAVVSTLVLCSCSQVDSVLREVRRVLVPGGKFYYMEHVIDEKFSWMKISQILGSYLGFFQLLVDGCRPDKNLEKYLRKEGLFANVTATRFRFELDEPVDSIINFICYAMEPHLYGVATAPE